MTGQLATLHLCEGEQRTGKAKIMGAWVHVDYDDGGAESFPAVKVERIVWKPNHNRRPNP
jgi:hypothetical protein